MSIRTGQFSMRDLVLVSKAPPPDDPPLIVGDRCRLNSGGPACLVVDASADVVTISWPTLCGPEEYSLPRACVRRIE